MTNPAKQQSGQGDPLSELTPFGRPVDPLSLDAEAIRSACIDEGPGVIAEGTGPNLGIKVRVFPIVRNEVKG